MNGRLLTWLMALCLASCSAKKTQQAEAPDLGNKRADLFDIPLSTINLPLRLSYQELAQAFNREMPELLYEDLDFNNNGGDNLMMVVRRTGPVEVKAKGEYLQTIMPISIFVRGRVQSTLGGLFSQANAPQLQQEANFNMAVTLSSKLELQPDWRISSQSQMSFKWTQRPYLEVGIVRIPIGSLIEKVVQQQMNELAKTLDQEAGNYLDFKKTVSEQWHEMQQPMPIPGPMPGWLILQPDSVFASRLITGKDALELKMGISSKVLLSTLAPDSLNRKRPKPMPRLQTNRIIEDDFRLYLTAGIDFETATRLARENLLQQTFVFDGGKHLIVLEDISIYGQGNVMVAKVKLRGKAKAGRLGRKKIDGTYYFKGTPYLDAVNMEIRLRDFDFDIKSRDLLLQSAEWLFKSSFKRQVEEQLRYSVKAEVASMRKLAEEALAAPQLGGMLMLSGRIDRLAPVQVQLSDPLIRIQLEAAGSFAASIMP
ncbi:MAG: DUF4403 family protein [Bacteroidia bacterium]